MNDTIRAYALAKVAQNLNIPGGAGYDKLISDIANKVRNTEPLDSDTMGGRAIGNDRLERLGKLTSSLSLGGVGAALGSKRTNGLLSRIGLRGIKNKKIGLVAGLSTGLLANTLGRTDAAVSRTPTSYEQRKYDDKLRWSNLIVPGRAARKATQRKDRERLVNWH